jgi:hypothetical protein
MINKIGYEIGIGSAHGVVPFEEACGRGSYPRFNQEYCEVLLSKIKELSIEKIVDYGCGNLECYKGHIDWSKQETKYVGYDVNRICVDNLKKLYPEMTFRNAVLDEIPKEPEGQAIIVKDLLIHWFDHDIKKFFNEVFDHYRYVFYMNFTDNQGYKSKKNRHAPHHGYGNVGLQYQHLYGCQSVNPKLLPTKNIIHKQNIVQDAPKTFIIFDRDHF